MDRVPKAHGVGFQSLGGSTGRNHDADGARMVFGWIDDACTRAVRSRSDAGGGIYRPAGRYVVGVRCAYYA